MTAAIERENAASSVMDKIGEVEKGLGETRNEVQTGAESMETAIKQLRDELRSEKERAAKDETTRRLKLKAIKEEKNARSALRIAKGDQGLLS